MSSPDPGSGTAAPDRAGLAPPAEGSRMPWERLPGAVRGAVEEALGSPVVRAVTQPGGFSPAVAARVLTADGGRAFVKAGSSDPNPHTLELYRDEVRVGRLLPASAPAPRLRWDYDDGTWVALLFEDLHGRQPALPWQPHQLQQVLAALGALHDALTPAPVEGLGTVVDRYAEVLTGWRRLAADPAAAEGLDAWSRRHLSRLAEVEAGWPDVVAGDTLLHNDVRADNLLLTPDGRVWFVDWPHACVGARWFDLAIMAPCVAAQGGPGPAEVLAGCPSSASVDRATLLPVAVAVAGYFSCVSLRPPPPGLPTVRAFQAAQGVTAREWVRGLTGWE